MHTRLTDHLDRNNLFYPYQFGFSKGHSTSHASIEVVDKISEAIDN